MRNLTCLIALAALAAATGCGGEDDDATISAPATSLTVVWEGTASAGNRPFGVVLVGPSDQIVTKARVGDPTEHSTVFTFGMGGSMNHGYLLVVHRLGDRPAPVCTHPVSVKHGFNVEATITPRPGGRCVIEPPD